GKGRVRIGEILMEAGKLESLVKELEKAIGGKVIKSAKPPHAVHINQYD
ncbi:MAG: hypothetical protein HZA00_04885, partial [Nitrospinae bacterium]|nr:hypothetical protein [Nitrospinota bacterium]